MVLYVIANKNLKGCVQWYPHFEGLEHVSNSRYHLCFASNGTMNSWRGLTPLNVVYHCPHPFRWAYICPSLHTIQQRTNSLAVIIKLTFIHLSKLWSVLFLITFGDFLKIFLYMIPFTIDTCCIALNFVIRRCERYTNTLDILLLRSMK